LGRLIAGLLKLKTLGSGNFFYFIEVIMTISRDKMIAWLPKLSGVMKDNRVFLTELDAAIEALNADNFGEKDEEISKTPMPAVPEPAAVKNGLVCGVPPSAGVAVIPAHLYRPALPKIKTRDVDDPEAEIIRLAGALNTARKEIGTFAAKAKRIAGAGAATIFDVHLLLLDDPDFVKQAEKIIRKERINAEAAWLQVIETTVKTYRSLDNAYMPGRAADVLDAENRVLRQLTGQPHTSLLLEAPALIVGHDIFPSDVARLDPEKVLGIVTAVGGSTSHAAILARFLGIPAVVGAGPTVAAVAHGDVIAIDGNTGNGPDWINNAVNASSAACSLVF